MKKLIIVLFLSIGSISASVAQTYADFGVGISDRDQPFFNVALRKQVSEKLRLGVELQTGRINQRFIGAKLIEEGTMTSVSVPASFRIYQDERLRFDLYTRAGVRFQNVSSDHGSEQQLEENSSFGFNIEPGFQVSLAVSDNLSLQSGVTLPNIFEVSPEFLYENNVTNIFANLGYKVSEKSVLFLKANTGPAAGAGGDSQKYTWSLQTGIRLRLSNDTSNAALFIDPSY